MAYEGVTVRLDAPVQPGDAIVLPQNLRSTTVDKLGGGSSGFVHLNERNLVVDRSWRLYIYKYASVYHPFLSNFSPKMRVLKTENGYTVDFRDVNEWEFLPSEFNIDNYAPVTRLLITQKISNAPGTTVRFDSDLVKENA